jgi:hypothetical protein
MSPKVMLPHPKVMHAASESHEFGKATRRYRQNFAAFS